MAFSFVITKSGVIGDQAYVEGTFDADSVTSGDIVTGLRGIIFSQIRNDVTAGAGLVDDTTTAGTMALTGLTSNDTGKFRAEGYL